MTGSGAANALDGQGGNDTLSGAGGIDLLMGGQGNDSLIGGAGNDTVMGDAGDDIIVYNFGDGTDVLVDGGADNDTLRILGTTGNNVLAVTFDGANITSITGANTVSGIETFTADLGGGTDTLNYGASSVGVAGQPGRRGGLGLPIGPGRRERHGWVRQRQPHGWCGQPHPRRRCW